jgi:hypothetical protein
VPDTHDAPVAHAWPQDPQFVMLVWVSPQPAASPPASKEPGVRLAIHCLMQSLFACESDGNPRGITSPHGGFVAVIFW